MKRIRYSSLAFVVVLAFGLLAAGLALAANGLDCAPPVNTPNPTAAIVTTHVFNDCPGSTTTTQNLYPQLVSIEDADEGCVGWANLHVWSFSEDGITPAVFENCSNYEYSCVFRVTGSGAVAEGGLRVSPWWSPDVDGRFMVRAGGNGEIACFGGRLPFYSFTAAYGVTYTVGEPIWMKITYNPHALTEADPATIEYKIFYQNQVYYSPQLKFDLGNINEAPTYGMWGELYPTRVGGYFQLPNGNGGAAFDITARWENIQFGQMATPAAQKTWGQLKSLYR